MGNRATVIFTDGKRFSPAVYHHWNGGPESIYGFLEELDRRKQRCDQDYECARYIQLVGEFLDQTSVTSTSLGVVNGPKSDSIHDLEKVMTDHSDNGFYLVNRTVEPMVVRRFKKFYGERDTKFVELSANMVRREREEADKSEYRPKFRAFFAELTKGKEIEGM